MILYSIVDKKSFEHVNSWLNILRQKSYGGLVYLIATKFDLEDDRVVQKAEGEKLAKDLGFNFFIETSSKNSGIIDSSLDTLVSVSELSE